MQARQQVRVGTSGWNYKHWRERFYPANLPASRWFEHYREVFDTVEINNTFYHLPAIKTFAKWRNQAPPQFCYAVKASRFITHVKKLKDPARPLRMFLARTRHLNDHLGPVLWQLPPHWKPNLQRLSEFCSRLPGDLTHVMEFRSKDWLTDEVFAILRKHHICLCVHDLLPDHPRELTGPALYVRFHGTSGHNGEYAADQLRKWATWFRDVAKQDHAVYAYFNNDVNAYAIHNALTLRQFVAE